MAQHAQLITDWLTSPWLGNAIAIGALIIAIIALFKTKKTEYRMVAIEEAREQDRIREKVSASLIANITNDGKRTQVHIENRGQATAREIKVHFDGAPFKEHKLVPEGVNGVGDIGPGSNTSILIAPTMGNADPFKIEITWIDDSGQAGQFSGMLSPV
ncbi:MAG TPA: hypothetical protein VIS94_11575 [Desulfomonilia bacterium]